jgi:hypothetical protein
VLREVSPSVCVCRCYCLGYRSAFG